MKSNYLALASALSLAIAAPAVAGLTIGGFTIAGPGKTNLAAAISATIYTNNPGNTDTCTTVEAAGDGAVRLTVVGDGTGTIDVAKGTTAALCRDNTTQIDLTCLAVASGKCLVQWRVDRD